METMSRRSAHDVSTMGSWSRLPEDVAMKVLARLPLRQFFRVRTVCKEWNSLTSNLEFRNLCNAHYHEAYFPVIMTRDGPDNSNMVRYGYDHTMETWQKLPPVDFFPGTRTLVAAAGGIMCFRLLFDCKVLRIILCNPLTRTCVKLPPFLFNMSSSSADHVLIVHHTGSYKIISFGKMLRRLMTQSTAIYESTARAWRVFDAQMPSQVLDIIGQGAVVCGGAVYCRYVSMTGQLGVIVFDIQAEAWQNVLYELPPIISDDGGDYQLTEVVACGGAVYMVLARGYGGTGSDGGEVTSLEILKLEAAVDAALVGFVEVPSEHSTSQQAPKAWSEVTSLCDDLLADLQSGWFGDDYAGDIVCVAHGTRICLAAGAELILVYDIQTSFWRKVPRCPHLKLNADFDLAEPSNLPMELRFTSLV